MVSNKTAFVCGWPVAHSRSPIIHNFWIKQHNINGEYIKHAASPKNFPLFINTLIENNYLGGNVTIPHKESAFELVEHLDAAAKRLGAVNTLWVENGELYGANTDGYGFLANLNQFAAGWDNSDKKQQSVIVLGAGGAARGIIDAIVSRGFQNIKIVNRTISRAENLASAFDEGITAHGWQELPSLLVDTGLLVNTTSLGMEGKPPLEIDLDPAPSNCLVNDIVYVPLQTPLLKRSASRGLRTVDGLGMLLHQAVPGFEKWFGVRPEVTDELRRLVIEDLVAKA
jgi:shikimate dehydrogenase